MSGLGRVFSQRDHDEARVEKIIRLLRAKKGCCFDDWIDINSPRWQRRPIVQIRRYQSLECNDGFSWDMSDDGWKRAQIFTFTDFGHYRGDLAHYLIGAAGFATYDWGIQLDFCWLHPFYRNNGRLKSAWPSFKERFGEFKVSKPQSPAMAGFLASLEKPIKTAIPADHSSDPQLI